MELLTRDYGKVQKGKGICDRVCGMAKARMRSWIAAGNDLKSAIDIEEGMEYAGEIKNTKVAVAEAIPDTGIQSRGKQLQSNFFDFSELLLILLFQSLNIVS